MFKTSRTITTLVTGLFFMPLLAFAQNADDGTNGHGKVADVIWNVAPFIVLAILFWFFFRRQVRAQQNSPLVKQHQAYQERHQQHMQRMEELMERIAAALEKNKHDA